MTDFETFKFYVAIKSHFINKNYDYFKYNKKTSISYEAFDKRPDKFFFLKLSKHSDIEGFLISNFLVDKKTFSKELVYNKETEKNYKKWLKTKQSLSYIFKHDIEKIPKPLEDSFLVKENNHPTILKIFLQKEITLETICILIDITNTMCYLNKHLNKDVVWDDVGNIIKKYTPFIKYDKEKFKKTLLENMLEHTI